MTPLSSPSGFLLGFPCLLLLLESAWTVQSGDIPAIHPFIFQGNSAIGKSVSATCLSASSSGPLTFAWEKNGQNIPDTSKVQIEIVSQFSVLLIDPVNLDSEGNYTCIVSNTYGSNKYSAYLQVEASPQWIEEPKDIAVTVDETLSLSCWAIGSPAPRITWRKVVDNGNTKVFSLQVVNGTFRLEKATEQDQGTYECKAENGIAPTLKKNVTVIVRVPARFEEKFAVVTARKSESARLRCEAIGDQPLSVTWTKEQTKLVKAGDSRYEIFETLMPKGIVSELIIRTTERADGGLYSCLAENEFGSDERKTRLLMMETPAPPLDVKVREVWSRSSSITWSSPYSGNSPITKYILQYWRDQGSPHRLHEMSAPSSQSSALIKDLHPGTSYALKIVAENAVGRGTPSETVKLQTGEEEPGSPPVDISVEPRGSSTIRVAWKPPPKDTWNGQMKGYYVGYKTRESTQPYSYKTVDFDRDTEQEYFLTNLLKTTDYSVVVKAFNFAGGGPASHEMVVRTLDGDLPAPPALFVLATSPYSVSLRWTTKKADHPITGFTVHYREETGHWQEVAVVSPDNNSYTLAKLQVGKMYQVYVTATNQFGRGDPSEIVAVKTDDTGERRLLSASMGPGGTPAYMDMAVLVPVAASLLTIFIVITVACICVRKIRSRQNLERALAAEKHLAMMGTMQRYVDIDKTRPLVVPDLGTPDHYPSPYATIPMADDQDIHYGKEVLNQEMNTFFPKDPRDRPLPFPKPNSLKRKEEHIYDSPQ